MASNPRKNGFENSDFFFFLTFVSSVTLLDVIVIGVVDVIVVFDGVIVLIVVDVVGLVWTVVGGDDGGALEEHKK